MAIFDWLKRKTSDTIAAENSSTAVTKPAPLINQAHKPLEIKPSEALLATSVPGWLLHTETGEGEPRASRFGGRPYMENEGIWPSCGACDTPLSFMMQYDLAVLDKVEAVHGSHLLRLFYCEAEECVGMGGWDAFSPQHHLSISKAEGACREAPDDIKIHPASHVVRWEKIDDVPHWADRPKILKEDAAHPYPGHKFGGWPFWIQGAERPNCPDCKSQMDTILQLDEYHSRSFNFGGGIGHITQCKTHPNILAFGWACG